MKTGKTLPELAQRLETIKKTTRDFIVPTMDIHAHGFRDPDVVGFAFKDEDHLGPFKPNHYAGGQVAQFTGIPSQYYRRLESENVSLLANNINHGMQLKATKCAKRMVRTFGDGKVRGFLSDRFRRLDSYDLLESIYPTFEKHGLTVISSEVTDRKMYIKALSPKLKTDIAVNDTVQFGIMISNSDVGAGSVRVEPLIYRLICANGMIMNSAMRKYHVGRNQEIDGGFEMFSDKTRNLDDAAFWNKVRDLVIGSLEQRHFDAEVERIKHATTEKIESSDPQKVVELAMKATGVSGETTTRSIVSSLAMGGDGAGYTKWGLANAFTRAAHTDNKMNYETATELERAGGKVLELTSNQWAKVSVN